MNNNTLLSIIITTYNRPKQLHSLLSDIYFSNLEHIKDLNLYIADDNSKLEYSDTIKYWKQKLNIVYYKNSENQGKNKCIFDILYKYNIIGKVMMLDDDMIFKFNLENILKSNINNDSCICINIYDLKNKQIIGDNPSINWTLNYFYYKKHKKGDKVWVFNASIFDLCEMKTFFIDNENAYDDCFWVNYIWNLKIQEIICNENIRKEYDANGVSNNLDKIRKNNPLTTINAFCIYIRRSSGICWKIFNNVRLKIVCKKNNFTWTKNMPLQTIMTKNELRNASIYSFVFFIPIWFFAKLIKISLN